MELFDMFWKRKPTSTPPKPMVARFTIYTKTAKLSHSEEYNGAHIWNEPEPICHNGMVRVGNHWINRDEIERIEVKYEAIPNLVGTGAKKGLSK
jgi:hypothetical protein